MSSEEKPKVEVLSFSAGIHEVKVDHRHCDACKVTYGLDKIKPVKRNNLISFCCPECRKAAGK